MEQHRTDWPGVWLGVALGWLTAFHYFKLPPALPVLLDQYAYAPLLAGSLMSVFALFGLLLSTWIGKNMQRIGAKTLVMGALALTAIGSVLGPFWADAPELMLASRALEALGYAVLSVVGVVLAVGSAAPRDRSLAAALWATWIPVGQLVAALISIPALQTGWWQAGWILGALACLPLMLLSRGRVPNPADNRDLNGAGNVVVKQSRAHLAMRHTALPALVFALWSSQFIAFMTWFPEYLVERQGLTAAEAAIAYLLVPAMIIGFNLVAGVLLGRGTPPTLILVSALLTQGVVWLLLPSVDSPSAGLFCLVLYGACAGLVPTCMFNLPHVLGIDAVASAGVFGALMAGRNLGALVGPVLLPQVHSIFGGWGSVAAVFSGVTLLAGAIGTIMMVPIAKATGRS